MKNKRILSMLLILILLAVLLPAGVLAAEPAVYTGDLDLIEQATDKSWGAGSIGWKAATKTLTLENAHLEGMIKLPSDATVIVKGNNIVEFEDKDSVGEPPKALNGSKGLKIMGIGADAALMLKGSDGGIGVLWKEYYGDETLDLEIVDITLDIESEMGDVITVYEGNLSVKSSTLKAEAREGISVNEGMLEIEDATITMQINSGRGLSTIGGDIKILNSVVDVVSETNAAISLNDGELFIKDSIVNAKGFYGAWLWGTYDAKEVIGAKLNISNSDVTMEATGKSDSKVGSALTIAVLYEGNDDVIDVLSGYYKPVSLKKAVVNGSEKLVGPMGVLLSEDNGLNSQKTTPQAAVYTYTPAGTPFSVAYKDGEVVLYDSSAKVVIKAQVSDGRISGDDRYETANEISKRTFPGGSKTVLIANGLNYPDALAAVPLAYEVDGPILLINGKTGEISDETLKQIAELGAEKIYLLGGTTAVSKGIEDTLKKSYEIERLGGDDRYETAALIADEYVEVTGKVYDTVFIASGLNYPDALSAGSAAALNGAPILFVDKGIPAATAEKLKDVETIYVAGGSVVVSEAVYKELPGKTERLAGDDRYLTGIEISKKFFAETEAVYTATGWDYADALTGGVAAAKDTAPLLLVDGKINTVPKTTTDYIKASKAERLVVLGGSAAVNDTVMKLLQAAVAE